MQTAEAAADHSTPPPGFEHVVEALRSESGIDDPMGVAWAMHGKGLAAEGRDPKALYRRFKFMGGEAVSGTGLGQLMRAGVKESRRCVEQATVSRETSTLGCFTPLREATFTPATDTAPASARVILITEGPGNQANRNFYPGEALRRSYPVFNGKKCFLNHPAVDEEQNRPERDVREVCGWFSETDITTADGRAAVLANLTFSKNAAGVEACRLIESALDYQRQFSGAEDVLVGFSINASGPSHPELMQGESWNIVEAIESAFSVDLVTFPARGGKALALLEAARVVDRYRFRRAFDQALASARFRSELRQELQHAA